MVQWSFAVVSIFFLGCWVLFMFLLGCKNKQFVATIAFGLQRVPTGRNPAPPQKAWETIVGWYLQGNRLIPLGFSAGANGFRPSTVG